MQTDDDLPEPSRAEETETETAPEAEAEAGTPAGTEETRSPRRFRKLKITAAVLAGLLVVVVGAGAWWLNTSLHASHPQTKGTLKIAGLQTSVEVDRDAQGVPQLYASNSHDLFFAQGYVQA